MSGPTAAIPPLGLARVLAAGEPPVIVRDHEAELGHFYLDPCNLHPGEAEVVAEALRRALAADPRPQGAMAQPRRSAAAALRWPD